MSAIVHRLEVTGSTNDEALALARAGEASGTAVVAGRQTAGRGRVGHHWETLSGEHVFLSVLHRSKLAAAHLSGLTLDVAVAVAAALDALGVSTTLKWPNDIFVGELKVGGILCELHTDVDPAGPVIVVGVGVNGNGAKATIPSELSGIATTLEAEVGAPVEVAALVDALVIAVRKACRRYEDRGHPDVAAWSRHDNILGRRVTLFDGRQGVAAGLASDGALLVQLDGDAGGTITVRSGIVTLADSKDA